MLWLPLTLADWANPILGQKSNPAVKRRRKSRRPFACRSGGIPTIGCRDASNGSLSVKRIAGIQGIPRDIDEDDTSVTQAEKKDASIRLGKHREFLLRRRSRRFPFNGKWFSLPVV